MKKMNKKGFTLIELLAVIVVLAIVMVIATQKITDVINSSRSNAFISSYKMIVKQINTNMATNTGDIKCGVSGSPACKDVYDISDDYTLSVSDAGNYYKIELSASTNGKFKNLNLIKYGDAKNATTNATSCDSSKVDNTVQSPESGYPASCVAQKIVGYVKK